MVLHNSKWDRKAKRQYLRKHGLDSKKEGDKEEIQEDLGDNSWRFKRDIEVSEDLDDDQSTSNEPELIFFPEENALFQNYEREKDMENLELAKEAARRKLNEEKESTRNHIKHVTEEDEIDEFNKLRENIERSKMLANVKRRFGNNNKKQLDISEEDFDKFLESVDNEEGEVTNGNDSNEKNGLYGEINPEGKNQDYIDELIGL